MLVSFLATASAWGFSIWAAGRLPARVAIHFDVHGRPDGWSSPGTALWLIPAIMVAGLALFWAIPKIDPRRASWDQHDSTYWTIVNGLTVFLLAVHVLVLGVSLGWTDLSGAWVPVGVGLLLAFIGNVLGRVRPNFFVGIRTPWTLSSDENWRRTHRVGGPAFVLGGLALAAAGLAGGAWLFVGIGALLVATVVPIVYSYVLWRQEQAGPG
jgi:uncharacterized membrane protein